MAAKKSDLKVDEEFRKLCPALGKESRQELELLLSHNRPAPPIRAWGQWIVDGFEIYELLCLRRVPLYGRAAAACQPGGSYPVDLHPQRLAGGFDRGAAPVPNWETVSGGTGALWGKPIPRGQSGVSRKLLGNIHTPGAGIRIIPQYHPTVWHLCHGHGHHRKVCPYPV